MSSTPASLQSGQSDAHRPSARRAAVAGGVGTMIEYYDFSLYGYLAIVLAPLFFPGDDPVVSLLSALAIFAGAYLVRPLGGIIFGHIGDRLGRRKALVIALVSMGAASTLMGLLPTYETAGVFATVLLVVVRLLQGISAGGELGGAMTLVAESVPENERARFGAYPAMGGNAGFALAAAVAGATTALVSDAALDSWGWRVPFLLALPLTFVCLWFRLRVEETFQATDDVVARTRPPLGELVTRHHVPLMKAVGLAIATNGTAYIGLSYLSIHLVQELGYDKTPVYWIATGSIGLAALSMPMAGIVGDRIGHTRLAMAGLLATAALSLPMMALMGVDLWWASVAYVVIMLATVATQVAAYTILPGLFPVELRYTGTAMGWNLGVVIAGGTAPFTALWLVETTGNSVAAAYFVWVAAAVGVMSVLSMMRGDRALRVDMSTESP
ncbi:MFS transporter [Pseudactinotalea sp.]|uniref:MFS transporter n=1 Tax=Pseudactinotalea sp. TaxID=1926260 RepID=UPI003B3A7C35